MIIKTSEEFIAACKAKDLSATFQRITIFRILQEMEGHPTVEEIYRGVVTELPTISLATVYKNLETLAQSGLIAQVTQLHDVTRYDVNSEPHHHLVCIQCRKIADVRADALPALTLPAAEKLGYDIVSYQVQFDGICETCRMEH